MDRSEEDATWQTHWSLLTSLAILVVMLVLEFGFKLQPLFPVNLCIFLIAFLLAGYKVVGMAFLRFGRIEDEPQGSI
ncbi:hypothetical protein [Flavitalea flava]